MTKIFTRTDGTTHTCESSATTGHERDSIDGKPVMKLIELGAPEHVFVFGTIEQLRDASEDHTID